MLPCVSYNSLNGSFINGIFASIFSRNNLFAKEIHPMQNNQQNKDHNSGYSTQNSSHKRVLADIGNIYMNEQDRKRQRIDSFQLLKVGLLASSINSKIGHIKSAIAGNHGSYYEISVHDTPAVSTSSVTKVCEPTSKYHNIKVNTTISSPTTIPPPIPTQSPQPERRGRPKGVQNKRKKRLKFHSRPKRI